MTYIPVGMVQKETRQEILMAAFEAIHQNGFRSTGINEILSKTNVTKGAFYHHFSSKVALGYAIVEEVLTFMVDKMWLDPLEGAEDPIACMQEIFLKTKVDKGSVILGCPLNNMAVEMSPVDEGFRKRVEKVYQHWVDGYTRVLEEGQTKGSVRKELDAVNSANFIVSAFAGCRSRAKNAQSVKVLVRCYEQLNLYLETLRA
jgi:TetR/AcrR family transcriptional repressor of nem operon